MSIVTLLNIPRISSQSSKREKIAETKFGCVYYDKINTTLLLQFFSYRSQMLLTYHFLENNWSNFDKRDNNSNKQNTRTYFISLISATKLVTIIGLAILDLI